MAYSSMDVHGLQQASAISRSHISLPKIKVYTHYVTRSQAYSQDKFPLYILHFISDGKSQVYQTVCYCCVTNYPVISLSSLAGAADRD